MTKVKENEMPTPHAYEESEIPYHNPPAQNEWEKSRWNSNGYDQSGMEK